MISIKKIMEDFYREKPISSVSSFKIGDLVKFNSISDDSDYASNCFCVAPEYDWFDVQVYTEECFGEVVKKNIIEIIYIDGRKSGKFYKIINGVVKSEIDKLVNKKKKYGLKLSDIFEGSNLRTMKDFRTITLLDFIPLKKQYIKKNCLLSPPSEPNLVLIWNKKNADYLECDGQSYYENGKWIDNKTKQENKTIDEFSKWETSLDRIYIKGKIFIEDANLKEV